MDTALRDHLVAACSELDTLTADVRRAPACREIASAIARRDAILLARHGGARVTVYELAALETERLCAGATWSASRADQGAMQAMRCLEALELARREATSRPLTTELLARLLAPLGVRAAGDSAITGLLPPASLDDPFGADGDPAGRVAVAARAHLWLAGVAQTRNAPPELVAAAGIASAIAMRPRNARADDPMPVPDPRALADLAVGDAWPVGRNTADLADWLISFAHDVEAMARRTRGLVARLSAMDAANRATIDSLGKVAVSCHRVHRALQQWPVATVDCIRTATGLQVQATTSALHRLRGLGIARESSRRHRRRTYIHDGYIEALGADIESWSSVAAAGS